MDLNVVVLAGRIAAEPETRTFESGARLVRYVITVRTDAPRRRIDVLPVTFWNPPPEVPPLDVGQGVWVLGSTQRRWWESADGRRSRIEIVAHHVEPRDPGDDREEQ